MTTDGEEHDAWSSAMRGVKRLDPSLKVPRPSSKKFIRIASRALTPLPSSYGVPEVAESASNRTDPRTLTKLKRGHFPIEATLDLHGYTQTAAKHTLERFIHTNYHHGKRCVLVVTGKGSPEHGSILRQHFPVWLNDNAIRGVVLAFCHAQPKDGGNGAFYVLLSRKKLPL